MVARGLGSEPLAERVQALLSATEDADSLDRREGCAEALHLAEGVVAAADQAKRPRVGLGEPERGDSARGAGSQLPKTASLDDCGELAASLVLE